MEYWMPQLRGIEMARSYASFMMLCSSICEPWKLWAQAIQFIHHLMLELKFDSITMFKWQQHSQGHTDIPDYQELLDFINLYAEAAETSASDKKHTRGGSHLGPGSRANKPVPSCTSNVHPMDTSCITCKGEEHPLYSCSKYRSLSSGVARIFVWLRWPCPWYDHIHDCKGVPGWRCSKVKVFRGGVPVCDDVRDHCTRPRPCRVILTKALASVACMVATPLLSHHDTIALLKSNDHCLNRLCPGHFVKECKSLHHCKCCQNLHHTLLDVETKADNPMKSMGSNPPTVTSNLSLSNPPCQFASCPCQDQIWPTPDDMSGTCWNLS